MGMEGFVPQQREWDERATKAQAAAAHAFNRLLSAAEQGRGGQTEIVVKFLACTFDNSICKFDPFDLRALDVDVSDDILLCLDALRWGRADLYTLVPDGERRVQIMLALWQLI
jgi:hypothetical protein